GARGRPAYELDLDRAILLHDLGNTWQDIAVAIGVSRSTLYKHMEDRGLPTARREWSDLTDDEIDELVSEFPWPTHLSELPLSSAISKHARFIFRGSESRKVCAGWIVSEFLSDGLVL
ncbi:hypothetical protein B0H17DRAFT_1271650, partial [Mycena rosella]